MPRINRSLLPDGVFHVTAHATGSSVLFRGDGDRRYYLSLLQRVVEQHGWRVITFSLMGNHVHLLLETTSAALSAGMEELHKAYARRARRREGGSGHVFRCRFHALPVLSERHLVACLRYIAINAVKDGFAARAADWRWSAHRALIGTAPPIPFVDAAATLALAGGRDAYIALVEAWSREDDDYISRGKAPPPVTAAQLAALVRRRGDIVLQQLRDRDRVPMAELGRLLGCDRSTVLRRIRAAQHQEAAS